VNTGLNASQGGVNGTGVALGGTATPRSNFGTGQFLSAAGGADATNQLSSNLLGSTSGIAQSTVGPQAESSWKNSTPLKFPASLVE